MNIVIEVNCASQSLENGQISYNTLPLENRGYTVGTLASFTCMNTYNLFGSEASICQENGTWNQAIPLCADSGNEILFLQMMKSWVC